MLTGLDVSLTGLEPFFQFLHLASELVHLSLEAVRAFSMLGQADPQVVHPGPVPVTRLFCFVHLGLLNGQQVFTLLTLRRNGAFLRVGLLYVGLERLTFLLQGALLVAHPFLTVEQALQCAFKLSGLALERFILLAQLLGLHVKTPQLVFECLLALLQGVPLLDQVGHDLGLLGQFLPQASNFPPPLKQAGFRHTPTPAADAAKSGNHLSLWRHIGPRVLAPVPEFQSNPEVGNEYDITQEGFDHLSVVGRNINVADERRHALSNRRPQRPVSPGRTRRLFVALELERNKMPVPGLHLVQIIDRNDTGLGVCHHHILQLLP